MTWGAAIRAWLGSPWHKGMVAFAIPALCVGAALGDSPWQLPAGLLGLAVWLIARAQGIEAGTDETAQQAQPEGQEPGPKDAPQ